MAELACKDRVINLQSAPPAHRQQCCNLFQDLSQSPATSQVIRAENVSSLGF